MEELVDVMDGMVIAPESSFSFLDSVAGKASHFGEDEGNFIASMFYGLALQSPLEIIERHSQGKMPPYSQPGIEVAVSEKRDKDLIVYNPGPNEVEIAAQVTGNTLEMSLYSANNGMIYEYRIENEKDINYRTIIRYDDELTPGHHQVLQNGQAGKRLEVYKINRCRRDGFIQRAHQPGILFTDAENRVARACN